MNKKYIVLHADEDGDMNISYMTAKEIKKDFLNEESLCTIFDNLPNLGYNAGVLIIDGKIVVPKPKKIVKDWDF